MIKIIKESKKDIQNFRDKYGDELTDNFLAVRKQLRPPYNDIYFWLKDNPMNEYGTDDAEILDTYLCDITSGSRTYQKKRAKGGAKTIYKDSNWQVIDLQTYEAAVYYGKNTKWCISGNYDGATLEGENFFDDYDNCLLYIDKKVNKKYCFATNPDYYNETLTLYDEKDNPVYGGDDCGVFDNGWHYHADGTGDINPMPRIEYNDIVYPYIYIDENTDEKVYVKENDEEQFRLEYNHGYWW